MLLYKKLIQNWTNAVKSTMNTQNLTTMSIDVILIPTKTTKIN